MRLIDADELIPSLKMGEVNADTAYGDGRNGGIYFAIWRIGQMPTIDAVPVKHGKWNCGDDVFEYAVCSSCKWDSGEPWEYPKKNFRYCPNCGARMENGGKEDE